MLDLASKEDCVLSIAIFMIIIKNLNTNKTQCIDGENMQNSKGRNRTRVKVTRAAFISIYLLFHAAI